MFLVLFPMLLCGAGCSSDDDNAKGSGGAAALDAGFAAAGGTGGGTGGGDAGSSDADCTPGVVTLQYDGFKDKGQIAFQGGFIQDECFAVTFTPPACSFGVESAVTLIGGEDAGAADFTVSVWDVDSGGAPLTKLGQIITTVAESPDNLTDVPLNKIPLPSFVGNQFAIAFCHIGHAGAPSIARDLDGVTPGKNWIFAGGKWTPAASLGVKGDWILRATIRIK